MAEKRRCKWTADDPLLISYHDREWGRPIGTDAGHLERMALEIFQCGLSWRIVLVKRPALREAFEGFALERVAGMGTRDVERLMANPAIIRNGAKIKATISNARQFIELAEVAGSYRKWFGSLAAGTPRERRAIFAAFKENFSFMGPETTKCYLMGVGKIPPAHDRGCFAIADSKAADGRRV